MQERARCGKLSCERKTGPIISRPRGNGGAKLVQNPGGRRNSSGNPDKTLRNPNESMKSQKKRMERAKGFELSQQNSQAAENTLVSPVSTGDYTQIRAQTPDIASPELARVVAAWEKLPQALQSAILAIVDSATK